MTIVSCSPGQLAVSDFCFVGEDIVQDKFNSSLHEQFSMLQRYICHFTIATIGMKVWSPTLRASGWQFILRLLFDWSTVGDLGLLAAVWSTFMKLSIVHLSMQFQVCTYKFSAMNFYIAELVCTVETHDITSWCVAQDLLVCILPVCFVKPTWWKIVPHWTCPSHCSFVFTIWRGSLERIRAQSRWASYPRRSTWEQWAA